jgi:hypothetical protein
MATIPRSQNHLAELLGLSKSATSRQVARGMPTDTLESAQAWRKRHLDPARTKGQRYDQNRITAKAIQPGAGTGPLHRANLLMEFAENSLAAGVDINDLLPSLRAAMAGVPPAMRNQVVLSVEVMRVLLAPMLAWLGPRDANPTFNDGTPIYCDGASMSDEDAQAVGEDWYRLACGEIPWATPQEAPCAKRTAHKNTQQL